MVCTQVYLAFMPVMVGHDDIRLCCGIAFTATAQLFPPGSSVYSSAIFAYLQYGITIVVAWIYVDGLSTRGPHP